MSVFAFTTLRARLRAVALVGAVGILAVATAGQAALHLARGTTAELVSVNEAQRYQMDSDMMHDAMRADVVASLFAAQRHDSAGVASAVASLGEHSARFIESLNKADQMVTDPAIKNGMPALRKEVETYAADAKAVQDVVLANPVEAQTRFERFSAQFTAVEDLMERFGDQIQADARTTQASTTKQFSRATYIIWGCFALFFAAGLGFAWVIAQSLGDRMAAIAAQIRELQEHGVQRVSEALSALARGEAVALERHTLTRSDDTSTDELGAVSVAVNQMADQCDLSIEACFKAQTAVGHTVQEIERLAGQVRDGVLDGHADVGPVQGRYVDVLRGVEGVLSAVNTPLLEARRALEQVADRNLEVKMDGEFSGEFARMQTALNTAVNQLRVTVGQVRQAAFQVDDAAVQLSSGSQQLANGASEQASSAEEISASLTELSSVAARSVEQASEVKASAELAKASVQKGSEAMVALNADMHRIKQSADATQRIVKTIDEIAFQTNLLALNAAVEAARAGDAGRGFAVVAEEVRALAIRSAEAAKQTAALIEEEIQNVDGGVKREEAVREQLTAARQYVERMAITIDEIVTAASHQATGMREIGNGVALMSEITQQVAANAEEAAASSEELTAQATQLAEAVKGFKTRDWENRPADRLSLNARRRQAA
ncbi:MAG: HAMP domain-containing protein [Gemmatimonadaceae bacterium]|nr:HAMP domain-containing protein [Gemmatimonadaceae bacterium]